MIQVLGVTEFLSLTNEIIHPLKDIAVEGEVSGFSIRQNKWVFFSIKDEESVLECFALAFRMDIPVEDGMKVRVHGYPSIYKKSGRFRMTVEKVEPIGEGDLKKAYEALKKKLASEGMFDISRKRLIPKIPEIIGFIGSRDSAAYSDFIKILNNRWSGVEVLVYDVRVQGDGAVPDIEEAFTFFNTYKQKADVLVLTRGGGSLEDLWAFNDERVAKAVFSSRIPVVCGVGHEKDESLADFVADLRASTPSNAAELITPDKNELIAHLNNAIYFLSSSIDRVITEQKFGIKNSLQILQRGIQLLCGTISSSLQRFMFSTLILKQHTSQKKDNITAMIESMHNTIQLRLQQYTQSVSHYERILKNLNPAAILKQGYAIVRTCDGLIVKNANQVTTGDEISIQFGKGKKQTKVL